MRYRPEDIPLLIGCHFRLNFECLPSEDLDYLIARYEDRYVYVIWPNDNPVFNDGKDWEARYEEEEFLNVLNDNHWRIVDLPVIDFDSICVE